LINSMYSSNQSAIPRVGMMVIIRNRRGIISEVRDFDTNGDGVYHIVGIDYKDDLLPYSEELLWENEPHTQLVQPAVLLKSVDHPMPNNDFDALVRASRWSAISPYLDPDGDGPLERLPASAPFFGALKVDDYQLIPLLKALRMPRVNLMIAHDVNLTQKLRDLPMTKKIAEGVKLLGLALLNHLIITKSEPISFVDQGLM